MTNILNWMGRNCSLVPQSFNWNCWPVLVPDLYLISAWIEWNHLLLLCFIWLWDQLRIPYLIHHWNYLMLINIAWLYPYFSSSTAKICYSVTWLLQDILAMFILLVQFSGSGCHWQDQYLQKWKLVYWLPWNTETGYLIQEKHKAACLIVDKIIKTWYMKHFG